MWAVIEIVAYFLGDLAFEVIFQLLANFVAEIIGRSFLWGFRDFNQRSSAFYIGCYCLCGLAIGLVSVWQFPALFIKAQWLRMANLLFSPVAAGGVLSYIGRRRRRHDRSTIRLETFFYGYLFSFSFVLVRFVFGR